MIQTIKIKIQKIAFTILIQFFTPHKVSKMTYDIGVSTLICHWDVDRAIYSLMSFFTSIHRVVPVYVVNDGSLNVQDIQKLKRYFSVVIEDCTESDKKMERLIKRYTYFSRYRFDPNTHIFKKKFDAYVLHPFSKCIYIDSDILFFKEPAKIIRWMKGKDSFSYYTCRHVDIPGTNYDQITITYYSYRILLLHHLLIHVPAGYNAGLLLIHDKTSISLSKLNTAFKLFEKISYTHSFLAEETATILSFQSQHCSPLSLYEYVNISDAAGHADAQSSKTVSLHYLGPTKNYYFYSDAIKVALKNRLFRMLPEIN